jgi:hypothetical protein
VLCPAQSRSTFEVRERRLLSRHEQVRNLSGAQLRDFLANKLLDPATLRTLEGILTLYRQVHEAQTGLRSLGEERDAIFRQQTQIQGNLQPLGRDGEEGALRQRYVAALGQLEDRLAAIAAEEQATRQQIERLEDQAARRIRRLHR